MTMQSLHERAWTDFLASSSFLYVDRANLAIVRELGDRAAQGRACGNLGNTHYLLGNFETAIQFHTEVREEEGGGGGGNVGREREGGEALENLITTIPWTSNLISRV